jgi:RNA polymerase sigma-70 factor (ECF subfamily)
MERKMPASECQQGTKRPILLSDRRSEELPSCSSASALATAILPDFIGKNRKSLSGPPDATGDGTLAYASPNATEPEQSASDELLLKYVAEGDKAAMHIMFARHRTRVLRFIRRTIRNPCIAEDLANQVFLDVWRTANRFENRARVSTWLLSIARFKAINSLRERTHENIDQDDVRGIADPGDTPDVALDRKQTKGILRACIAKLSPAHREIIDMVYDRENSAAEVSEMLDIPLATVKSRMFYARKQLARMLVSAGFEAAAVPTLTKREKQGHLAACI